MLGNIEKCLESEMVFGKLCMMAKIWLTCLESTEKNGNCLQIVSKFIEMTGNISKQMETATNVE